jgi:hypothetical protein
MIVIRLERQPHFAWVPALLVRHLRDVVLNVHLVSGSGGRIGQQLCMAAAVQGDEQERGLVNRLPAGDDAMIS